MNAQPSYSIDRIAQHVGGERVGESSIRIHGIDQLNRATPGQITFIRDAKHAGGWAQSQASAALVGPDVQVEPGAGRALIRVPEADLAVAAVLELFAPPWPRPEPGIHPHAVVDPTAKLGKDVAVGPCAIVGREVVLGDGTAIHANVTICDQVHIGAGCVIWSGTVIRERCELGDGCILHPNVTIGSDGFGYRPSADGGGLVKIPQIGTVRIGRDVEIGAGTCVDRGKFAATVIGDGTKIDNLCQIAHNCVIGRCVVIAGQCGLAGGVTIGDGAMLGGRAGVREQITIGAGARVAAASAVMDNVPAGQTWAGYPAHDARLALREAAAMRKLPGLLKSLKSR